jgi:hypothetical protein
MWRYSTSSKRRGFRTLERILLQTESFVCCQQFDLGQQSAVVRRGEVQSLRICGSLALYTIVRTRYLHIKNGLQRMSHSNQGEYAANNDRSELFKPGHAEPNPMVPPAQRRGLDPPTNATLALDNMDAVTVNTTIESYTSSSSSSTAPTLPTGQVIDAKNTVQSHIVVVTGTPDLESNLRVSGSEYTTGEHNFEPHAAYHHSGNDPSILVTDAWNPTANAAVAPPPPRAEPIFYQEPLPHLSDLTTPHPSHSVGTSGSGGTRYSTGTPFVAHGPPPPTSPPVHPHNDQSADATAMASGSHNSNENDKTKAPCVLYANIAVAVVIVAVIVVSVVLGVCGTSGCGKSSGDETISTKNVASSNNNPALPAPTASALVPTVPPMAAPTARPTMPPTALPTASPTNSRETDLVDYINSITLSGRTNAAPDPNLDLADTPPEELALQWIIQLDPLQLSPDSTANQFRIRQRYALKTLWVQRAENPFDGNDMDECTWYGITCTLIGLGSDIGAQNAVTKLDLRNAARPSFLPHDLVCCRI